MTEQTLNKEITDKDDLARLKGMFESALRSETYQKWREEAKQAWAFYDGEQWTVNEISKLAESSQPPIVINKIAPKIDNIAGSEISSRTRILFRSRSGDKVEEETARALSDLALYVAERTDQAMELSSQFKAGLVTGIGWLDTGVETAKEGPFIFNRYEDEMGVVWDTNARRDDYSDARFVSRERWLDKDDLMQMFPKNYGALIEKLNSRHFNGAMLGNSRMNFVGDTVNYLDADRALFRVIEVQYKKTEKRYRVKATTGEEFVTFDREKAFSNKSSDVTSEFAARVYLGYFSDDILLSHKPLGYEHNAFTLVPYIFKRDRKDGRPYGLIRTAIDPQRELNKRRSKAMHLLNTAQVIADIDAVEDPNLLAREAARPDGVILKRPGKDLRIIRNSDLASSQVNVMEQSSRDIQEVMGVFDESIGKQSNATSGVAIQTRQLAGNLNQVFAFDALRRTKKKLGEMMLMLIQQFFTSEMVIQITDDLSAPRIIYLNKHLVNELGEILLDEEGNPQRYHDVRRGVFDIHVEEVADASSSREMDTQQLNMLINAGIPVPPHFLVSATNLRNKDEILAAMGAGGDDSAKQDEHILQEGSKR